MSLINGMMMEKLYSGYPSNGILNMTKGKQTIAIIGGSFNPPTKAHIMMGTTFRDRVDEDFVIFVSAESDYIRNWKNTSKMIF